jgi:hypothetical protein
MALSTAVLHIGHWACAVGIKTKIVIKKNKTIMALRMI